MKLFQTIVGQRLIVVVELVGEQLRARLEQREVADAEDAHQPNALARARPVERIATPVLESGDERTQLGVGLRASGVGAGYARVRAVVQRREERLVGDARIFDPVPEVARHLVIDEELDERARGRDVYGTLGEADAERGRCLTPLRLVQTFVHPHRTLDVSPGNRIAFYRFVPPHDLYMMNETHEGISNEQEQINV